MADLLVRRPIPIQGRKGPVLLMPGTEFVMTESSQACWVFLRTLTQGSRGVGPRLRLSRERYEDLRRMEYLSPMGIWDYLLSDH
jgi:hypothetical protein